MGPGALGRHIGYLPQDFELFAGAVADIISCFEPDPRPRGISARTCPISFGLFDGYDTQIGEGGTALSAGQRQRVAARERS